MLIHDDGGRFGNGGGGRRRHRRHHYLGLLLCLEDVNAARMEKAPKNVACCKDSPVDIAVMICEFMLCIRTRITINIAIAIAIGRWWRFYSSWLKHYCLLLRTIDSDAIV